MSELGAIINAVQDHPCVFDFTRDTLGESLCWVAAEAIQDFMSAQLDPNGNSWAPLTDAYRRMKEKYYPGEPISVLEHHMRTLDQLVGLSRITPDTIDQQYGIDEQARDEAEWFQEGNEIQRARRFYEFNDKAINDLDAWLDDHFRQAFR